MDKKNTCFKIFRNLLVNLSKISLQNIEDIKKCLFFTKKPLKVNYFL